MSSTHVGKTPTTRCINTYKLNVFHRRLAGMCNLKDCASIVLLLVVLLLAVSAMVLAE
ncbi:MAG: hypothetical protein QXR36_02995 [Desulfurococcaceae archaeon]